jgi:hypothetical protein
MFVNRIILHQKFNFKGQFSKAPLKRNCNYKCNVNLYLYVGRTLEIKKTFV